MLKFRTEYWVCLNPKTSLNLLGLKNCLLLKKDNGLSLHKEHARTLPKINVSQQDY